MRMCTGCHFHPHPKLSFPHHWGPALGGSPEPPALQGCACMQGDTETFMRRQELVTLV